MIFGIPFQLWSKVVGGSLVAFGIPCLFLWRWLKKHPESPVRTWINVVSAIVLGGGALARFHSWPVLVLCVLGGACLYADARKRSGKGLFANGK